MQKEREKRDQFIGKSTRVKIGDDMDMMIEHTHDLHVGGGSIVHHDQSQWYSTVVYHLRCLSSTAAKSAATISFTKS